MSERVKSSLIRGAESHSTISYNILDHPNYGVMITLKLQSSNYFIVLCKIYMIRTAIKYMVLGVMGILLPFSGLSNLRYENPYYNGVSAIDSIPKFDLEKYKAQYIKSNKFEYSGKSALNLETTYDTTFQLNYGINFNALGTLYGVSIPIQFNYSNGRYFYNYDLQRKQLPSFNRIGLSPSYKNWTVHIGYRSLRYSEHSLHGHLFKGAGFEYEGQRFYLSSFKGNLLRSSFSALNSIGNIESPYTRGAWGMKAGIIHEDNNLSFILLKIEDVFSDSTHTNSAYRPSENAVIGLEGTINATERIAISSHLHYSAFTYDTTQERIDIKTGSTAYNLFGLFTKREGSRFGLASATEVKYAVDKYEFQVKNELVNADYRSMGSLNFLNNYNNTTAKASTLLLEDRINISGEIGIQLQGLRSTDDTRQRVISNLNTVFKCNEQITLNLSLSNFSNTSTIQYTQLNSPDLDSLSLVNENFNVSSGLHIRQNNNTYSLTTSYSESSAIVDEVLVKDELTRIIAIHGMHSYQFNTSSNLETSFSYSRLKNAISTTQLISPSLSYSFQPFDNGTNILSIKYNDIRGIENKANLNLTNSFSYQLKKQADISLVFNSIINTKAHSNNPKYLLILNGQLNYAF